MLKMNFQMFKLDLEKAEEPEIKLPTSVGLSKKQGSSKKISTSASLTTLKPLTLRITANCGVFLKRWEYQTNLPASWETCMQDKKQQLEPDMEQQTGSKLGKEYVKVVYCHSAYLTTMHSTSCKMLCWINHKLESRLPGEIATTQVCGWHHSNGRKWRRTKEPPDEGERGEWRSWLKTQHSKTKILASGSITSWQIDGKTMETVTDFLFLASKITAEIDCGHEMKRHLLLGRKAMANLHSVLKAHTVKAMVFPVVMYGCESWTIKKAECQRIDAFKLWCWRRLMRVSWTARS